MSNSIVARGLALQLSSSDSSLKTTRYSYERGKTLFELEDSQFFIQWLGEWIDSTQFAITLKIRGLLFLLSDLPLKLLPR